MKWLAFLIVFGVLANSVVAQETGLVRGSVKNAESGTPLAGANISVEKTSWGAVADAAGLFTLSGLPPGDYTVKASFVGLSAQKMSVRVKAGVTAQLEFLLAPRAFLGQEVVVTATRARARETPVAFSDLPHQEIERRYWAQDMPMLLAELPSTYAYSDNGNGIGYSYMKIRGFDQKRIGVMINGIPLNDAESHEVFWVDLPDFAANVHDIQVQRGVGNSLYGGAAFGGSVNVLTVGAAPERKIEASGGWGSFNTRKYSVAANSGLLDNTYSMYGRFSRIQTDGYRRLSWSDLWSYFLGLARYDGDMVTRVNVYGGPERSHLAYSGIDRQQIEKDRTYNPLAYPNEIDVFNQPHYELMHDWQIQPSLRLENTLFCFEGDGYYHQLKTERKFKEYFGVDTVYVNGSPKLKTDLVRKRSVDEADYGWLPKFVWNHDMGELTTGAEIRIHNAQHCGEVTWAAIVPPGFKPDNRYYDYRVHKQSFTFFAHEMYRLTPEVTAKADLQVRHHWIGLRNEQRFRTEFDRKYTFVNPRLGVNYNVTQELNLFGSASWAQREPAFKEIYNPQDFEARPYPGNRNFEQTSDGRYLYVGKSLEPEKLTDLELGIGYGTSEYNVKLNLFWMNFRDEIVPTGQIDDNGVPISGNAARSLHQGVELSCRYAPVGWLTFSGNVSYNDARLKSHAEYDYAGNRLDYDGNRIAGFPDWILNLRGWVDYEGFLASLHMQHVGKMFLDNTQNEERINGAFTVLNAALGYRLEGIGTTAIEAMLHIQNLGDVKYEASGYVDNGTPYWIPAAGLNLFFSVRVIP